MCNMNNKEQVGKKDGEKAPTSRLNEVESSPLQDAVGDGNAITAAEVLTSIITKNKQEEDSLSKTGIIEGDDEEEESEKFEEETRDEIMEVQKLAEPETRNVQLWRIVVVILIAAAAAGLSYMTWAFLSTEEADNHNDAFYQFTTSIGDITKFRAKNVYEGLRGLSETVTAHAQRNREEWPMVTLPNFEVAGEHTRVQTKAELITFAPIVTLEQREAYEPYIVENQWWLAESRNLTLKKAGTLIETSPYVDMPINGNIIARCETGLCPSPNVTDRPYMPNWQSSPPPFNPRLVGSDGNDRGLANNDIKAASMTKDVVMGVVFPTGFLTGSAMTKEAHDLFHDQFISDEIGNSTSSQRPHLVARTPIFRTLGDRDSDLVGVIVAVIALDSYMADLLPDGVNGIDLVVRNTCGQNYTYTLTGGLAGYLGDGDLHDARYDDDEIIVDFNDFLDPELSKSTPGHCIYTFSLYPTDSFVATYTTYLPALFTAVVALSFFLMFLVFFVYDYMSGRRNDKVVDAAARTNAIVSSLFPSNVRNQLIEEANVNTKRSGVRQNTNQATTSEKAERLKAFMASGNSHNYDGSRKNLSSAMSSFDDDKSDDLILPGKPLAELFPESTVMFADIAGFTAWSADRDPTEVFTLLETLYRSFDRIAKKRGIFKIETIGDCYVAVAGIPEPRKDHAIAMCRFARDCTDRMSMIIGMLAETLGPSTRDLSLRTGLHSGPCTAGVLRGEKARFQLFGDTMNTASRMESTGMKGRIQLSQATADILILAGKKDWVIAREGTVHAKGKGELQTYWLVWKFGCHGPLSADTHSKLSIDQRSQISED